MDRYLKLFATLVLIAGFYACARQGVPTGGSKDTTPPAVDTLGSTPNFATRFEPKRLELKFNEWITLSEAAAQVVVSPPLVKRPEVLLRGKKVIVKFDENEKFRENTTYTINFGTAIKDLHEGNAAKDLRFVFSTGDYIDSLSTKGKVADAFTAEPIENVAVMLYDIADDSVVRKDRPYYFSRSDKQGDYEMRNLKAGGFKVVAVEDLDQNLRWDGENERIGFLDTLLQLGDSTQKQTLALRLFKNVPRFRIADKNAGTFGVVKLKFNTSADSAMVQPEALDGLKVLLEKTQDSMQVWYDLETPAAWKLFVNRDTVPVKVLSREDFMKKHLLHFAFEAPAATGGKKQLAAPVAAPIVKTVQQNPEKPALFQFNYPVVATDTAKWVLTNDSLRVYGFATKTDSAMPRQVRFEYRWSPGKSYRLEVLPGGATDFWGQTNTDTLRRILAVPTDKQLGGLNLRLMSLRPGQHYIVQLLNGTTVEEERVLTAEKNEQILAFTKLNVATYTARLIEDSNGNGRWDTGDYWAHRQPEPINSKKLESLRANWEVESTLSLQKEGPEKKRKL